MVVVVVGYYLHTARGGRELYAIGSDPDAAVLYGLNVRRRVIGAFVLSGALAGLAGVVFAARYGSVSSGAGTGIELQAVAAVVVGGVAIFGGSGTVWGAAIGAMLLVTINRVLPILGIPDFWQQALVGALILSAIALDRVLSLRRARQLIEARDAVMSTRTYPVPRPAPVAAAAGLPRGRGDRAARRWCWCGRSTSSPTSPRQLTMTYLFLDIAPILLIALPMTLIIVTGEIDLSVASVVGLSSVMLGTLVDHGTLGAGRGARRPRRRPGLRRAQRLPGGVRRTAVARGHHRHPRALPRHRGRRARHQGGHRLPRASGATWPSSRSAAPASR